MTTDYETLKVFMDVSWQNGGIDSPGDWDGDMCRASNGRFPLVYFLSLQQHTVPFFHDSERFLSLEP
jgi:hypothetical protein